MAFVRIYLHGKNPEEARRVDLTREETSIGRDAANDVVVEEEGVSRRHAKIVKKGGSWWLLDAGSQNGIWIGDHKVSQAQLRDGTTFRIGVAAIRFHDLQGVETGYVPGGVDAVKEALRQPGFAPTEPANPPPAQSAPPAQPYVPQVRQQPRAATPFPPLGLPEAMPAPMPAPIPAPMPAAVAPPPAPRRLTMGLAILIALLALSLGAAVTAIVIMTRSKKETVATTPPTTPVPPPPTGPGTPPPPPGPVQITPTKVAAATAETPAGPDRTAQLAKPIELTAFHTPGAGGAPPRLRWSFQAVPKGSSITDAALGDATQKTVKFTPDHLGTYTLTLTVDTGSGTVVDTVNVMATKIAVQTSGLGSPLGLSLFVKNKANPAVHGARLDVPPNALPGTTTISMGTVDSPPPGAPAGPAPLGTYWELLPDGLQFAEPVTITLPVPDGLADLAEESLYVARWSGSEWEDLGGTVKDGLITAQTRHFSTYGVFSRLTKRRVVIENASATPIITLTLIAGPSPDPEDPTLVPAAGALFLPLRPTSGATTRSWDIAAGRSQAFELPAGLYRFSVAYPTPQPGVANDLTVAIPRGVADSDIRITITDTGATATDPKVVRGGFAGKAPAAGSNQAPAITCAVTVPSGVPLVRAGGDRLFEVGPIKVEQMKDFDFNATVSDPEGSALRPYWTVRGPTGRMTTGREAVASGGKIPNQINFRPTQIGVHRLFLTIYDNLGLFAECAATITVVPNSPPELDLFSGRNHVEFGRLDSVRSAGVGPVPTLPAATVTGPATGPLTICPTAVGGTRDPATGRIGFKTLPKPEDVITMPAPIDQKLPDAPVVGGASDSTHRWPYPGRTCVWALIADGDLDAQTFAWEWPGPLYGAGNYYAAVEVPVGFDARVPAGIPIGAFIGTGEQLAVYNAFVSSLWNTLGVIPAIVWESWDDPCPDLETNPCPSGISRGGVENMVANTTDGFARPNETGWHPISVGPEAVQPGCEDVMFISSMTPSPSDPGPLQPVRVTVTVTPMTQECPIEFSVSGTDGYSASPTVATNKDGEASMTIPGGGEGIVDVVTARIPSRELEVQVTYTF